MSDFEHGTYAGYQKHIRTQGHACAECRAAAAAYQKTLRDTNPRSRKRELEAMKAADRARRQLAADHPDEYAHHYAAALGQIRGIR